MFLHSARQCLHGTREKPTAAVPLLARYPPPLSLSTVMLFRAWAFALSLLPLSFGSIVPLQRREISNGQCFVAFERRSYSNSKLCRIVRGFYALLEMYGPSGRWSCYANRSRLDCSASPLSAEECPYPNGQERIFTVRIPVSCVFDKPNLMHRLTRRLRTPKPSWSAMTLERRLSLSSQLRASRLPFLVPELHHLPISLFQSHSDRYSRRSSLCSGPMAYCSSYAHFP